MIIKYDNFLLFKQKPNPVILKEDIDTDDHLSERIKRLFASYMSYDEDDIHNAGYLLEDYGYKIDPVGVWNMYSSINSDNVEKYDGNLDINRSLIPILGIILKSPTSSYYNTNIDEY